MNVRVRDCFTQSLNPFLRTSSCRAAVCDTVSMWYCFGKKSLNSYGSTCVPAAANWYAPSAFSCIIVTACLIQSSRCVLSGHRSLYSCQKSITELSTLDIKPITSTIPSRKQSSAATCVRGSFKTFLRLDPPLQCACVLRRQVGRYRVSPCLGLTPIHGQQTPVCLLHRQ